jgi:hypothetical protein
MTFALQRHRIDKVSQDAVIAELRRVAEYYGFRYFTGREFNQVATTCKKTTVLKLFGSWEAALRAAGLELAPTRKPRSDQIPEAALFAELERIWRLRGHRPSRAEWEASNPHFSYTTYKTRFDSWTNACVRFIEFKSGKSLLATSLPMPIQPSTSSEPTSEVLPSKTRNIPLRLRARVMERDRFRCVFCGRSPATHNGVYLHIDHKVPFSAGGETTFGNLQTLCRECNLGKGNAQFHQAARSAD